MDSARQADPRPRATLTVPTAPPAAAGLRRAGCSGQRRHSVRPLRAQGADGSFDEGGLDYKLAKELDTASWSVRKAAVTKHLELLYQASQSQSEVRVGPLATGSPSPGPAGWGCRRRRRRRSRHAAGAGALSRAPAPPGCLPEQRPRLASCSATRWSGASPAAAPASASAAGATAQASWFVVALCALHACWFS